MDLRELLQEEGYEVVAECGRGDEAVTLVREHRPTWPCSTSRCRDWTGSRPPGSSPSERLAAVVLVTAFSQRELIEEASDAGVYGYIVKPFERHDLVPAIEIAIARFRGEKALADQVATASERLEVRKLVDRAKGMLMDSHALSEQASFDFIQKTAMRTRRTMKDVAAEVIAGNLTPDGA